MTCRRVRCDQERCRTVFTQTRVTQTTCPDCRADRKAHNLSRGQVMAMQRRKAHQASMRERQEGREPEPMIPLSEVRKRVEWALEPFLGRPELDPILTRLLGAFGAPAKEAAA